MISGKVLTWLTLLLLCQAAFGQGTVNFVNNVPGVFRSLVYGEEPGNDTSKHKSGQSADDTPPGTTVYNAPLVAGTGFTVQLWWFDGVTTDPSAMAPAQNGISTFRTGAAAGIWTGTAAVLPGRTGGMGTHVTAQVRVWDNKGGTVGDWSSARLFDVAIGFSDLFQIDNIGDGNSSSANMANMLSFNLTQNGPGTPEPSVLVLAIASGTTLFFVRRSRK
jgi:hypothetical protein